MKWYFPSWNGDFRLLPVSDSPNETMLVIEKPTLDEARLLNQLGAKLLTDDKISSWTNVVGAEPYREVRIHAPMTEVGPRFLSVFKPGPAVLSALRYEDGHVITTSGGVVDLEAIGKQVEADREAGAETPTAAATVKRPTPSCPACVPGSVARASEVLLAFLSPDEHETWARERAVYVEGGVSGIMYRLAHRHTKAAERQGRMCLDIDNDIVLHFHDWTVPPEEEVLAAMLILRHREPWLRNEATLLGATPGTHERPWMFKNPFGDAMDGVADASATRAIGRLLGFSDGVVEVNPDFRLGIDAEGSE